MVSMRLYNNMKIGGAEFWFDRQLYQLKNGLYQAPNSLSIGIQARGHW